MRPAKDTAHGAHSALSRACSLVGGSYFSLFLLALELASISLSIGVLVVYGPGSVPDPRPSDSSPWVWVSPANSTHVAVTVRLFAGSDSLFICKSPPTSTSPCSPASALQTISIPVAADGSGLFKTVVGGLLRGTRYYYQVGLPLSSGCRSHVLKLCRLVQGLLAHFSLPLRREQISNSLLRRVHPPTRIP